MSSQHFIAVGPHEKKIGIVANHFKEFLRKCRKKFYFEAEADICVTLDDGTEVDEEYFEVLQSGTRLIVKRQKKEKSDLSYDQLAAFLHKCLLKQPKIHDKVTDYLQQPEKAAKVLNLLAQVAETSCLSSKKEDDSEWFTGLNTKFTTKEAVMRNSAETRMRGYLEQAKKLLFADDHGENPSFKKAIEFFKEKLRRNRYNSSYFDRSAASGGRLCNKDGVFECEGLYNRLVCKDNHTINPYKSRESRIVFSTWNLDHVIEKSRNILPVLKTALEGPRSSAVNLSYFYELLFIHQCLRDSDIYGNLKLVHIACHDKKPHVAECTRSKVYVEIDKEARKSDTAVEGHNDDVDGGMRSQSSVFKGMITRQRSRRLFINKGHENMKKGVGISTRVSQKRVLHSTSITSKPKRCRLVR